MNNKQHHQTTDHQRISQNIQEELDDAFKTKNSTDENECYTTGETNTINFIKADGQQQMFPYSQLITAWTEHTDEENIIKIFFSTHLVTIQGYNLEAIFQALTNQSLKLITTQDERYFNKLKQKNMLIKKVVIDWKKGKI